MDLLARYLQAVRFLLPPRQQDDIVRELSDRDNPDIDPAHIRFTDLFTWVTELEGFDDDPKRCGERILEEIQAAWIEEAS